MVRIKAIDRKLFRDVWRLRGQAIAIAAVIAAAVATVMLSMGTQQSLLRTRAAYYQQNNFADVFAQVKRAPERILDRINAIDGVQLAVSRVVQYGLADMPDIAEPVRLAIYSIPETRPADLNTIIIREGRRVEPDSPDEIVLHEAFASAHDLHPGDSVTATVYGKQRDFRVVGVGLAPDFIYALGPGDLVPDDKRFGIAWMGRDALEAAANMKEAFNSVSLRLRRDASEEAVIGALDVILEPYGGTGAYGREDHLSHAFIESELDQLGAMTQTIPPIFLAVSTFLVYLVLSRLIQSEREEIGLLKAFGYTNFEITSHYLKLTLIIAALGILVGWGLGAWMGRAMTELYGDYYRFPFLSYQLSPKTFAASAMLSFVFSILGAMLGARQALTLTPAIAMAPPPPVVYRQSWLERMAGKAGFTTVGSMIVRHILRWPGRAMMTLTGVSLSLGLLFTTMQFIDSTNTMLNTFFFRSQHQDVSVSLSESRHMEVVHDMMRQPGVLHVEPQRSIPVRLTHGQYEERAAIEATDNDARLSQRIDADGARVFVPPGGLVLTEMLAEKLNVRAGERVHVELLQGKRTETDVPVTRVITEYIGTRAYMDYGALNRLAGEGPLADGLLLKADMRQSEALFEALKDMPMVAGVSRREAALTRFREMIDQNIFTMIFFYIGFASIIVVGVIYNSARITLAERSREFATLRVLGFRGREVALILVGEMAALIAFSLPLGCVIGNLLARLVAALFSSDLFRLPFAPEPRTYGFSVVVILAAAILTAVYVSTRVRQLDLIGVLKARD